MNIFLLAAFFICRTWGEQAELFDASGKIELKSYLTGDGFEWRKDHPGDVKDQEIKNVGNPSYLKQADNPQFGYSVELLKFIEEGEGFPTAVALIGGPGNAEIKFNDAGFVEIQSLDPPITSYPAEGVDESGEKGNVLWFPMEQSGSKVQSNVGSSLAADASSEEALVLTGAPLGAQCSDTALTLEETLTFNNFGSYYKNKLKKEYVDFINDIPIFKMESSGLSSDSLSTKATCFQGSSFGGANQGGFAQMNRNLYGFSAHISRDHKYSVMGAPMFKQLAGYVDLQYRSDSGREFDKFVDGTQLGYFFLCGKKEVLEEYKYYAPSGGKDSNLNDVICDSDLTLGYSVTSVQIKKKSSDELTTYIVASGPRANGLHGRIRLFHWTGAKFGGREKFNDIIHFLPDIIGLQFNSGFGTIVLGVDLDGDGTDELLVGEPYYTDEITETFNSGRVLVYSYNSDAQKYSQVYSISSPSSSTSGLFGYNIASVGDTNDDGGEDFVVAAITDKVAPLRIYSGRQIFGLYSSATAEKPLVIQSIANPSPSKDQSVFGFSMGQNRVDLDGNGFNDFLVGDPVMEVQRAFLFYANTFIRLVYPDKITDGRLFPQLAIDGSCPSRLKGNGVNFCQPLKIVVENRGRNGSWNFTNAFDLQVSTEFIASQSFQIDKESQTVNVKTSKPFQQELTFFVYGELEIAMGERVKLIVKTTPDSDIKLVENFKGKVVHSPETSKYINLAIGKSADVRISSSPGLAKVILGEQGQLAIDLEISGSGSQYLIAGEVQIRVGDPHLIFSSAQSTPNNIASCSRQESDSTGSKLLCKVVNGKEFSKMVIHLYFDVTDISEGNTALMNIPITSSLVWTNREESDDSERSAETTVNVAYSARMEITAENSVLSKTAIFPKEGTTVDHTVKLANTGSSKVGKTQLNAFIPNIAGKLELNRANDAIPDQCTLDSKNAAPFEECKDASCLHYVCDIDQLPGYNSFTATFTLRIIDASFYSGVLSGKDTIKSHFTYKVLQAADYTVQLENMYPENQEGSLYVVTTVRSAQEDFPWWILIVTLIVCIALVVAVIVILFKRGFFKKKQHPDKIRVDLIKDDEAVDEDEDMRVNIRGASEL